MCIFTYTQEESLIRVPVEARSSSVQSSVSFLLYKNVLESDHGLSGILVRDDRARDKLREQVGDVGLILCVKSLFNYGCILICCAQDALRE